MPPGVRADIVEQAAPTRELTPAEAVAIAVRLQQNGQLEAAAKIYQQVLDACPDQADARHYAGVLAHQQGRSEHAVALIEQSLALVPDQPQCHNNLGIIFQSTGNLTAAMDAYRRAIAIDPRHANAHSNLGVLLKAVGNLPEAEKEYRIAIQLDPNHVDAYTNLGVLLTRLRRAQEAAACYCKVITLRPKHREARRLLALAHCTLGETDEAVRIFQDWLEEEPNDPVALHMYAACTGRDIPVRASNQFVEVTFDSFASSFELKLDRLSYRAPALVGMALEEAGLERRQQLDVLDAGCGTGLCAPFVAPYARRLTGVDLSAQMLEHARQKDSYHVLVKAELTDFLRSSTEAFDVIVSADTLVYFGDLQLVVAGFVRLLRSNGVAVFTLEHAIGQENVNYRLEHHGRYSHGQRYIEELLVAAGLIPDITCAELRMESGVPVAGLVVRATKP